MNTHAHQPHHASGAQPPSPGVFFPPPLLLVAGFLAGLALERWGMRMRIPSPGAVRALLLTAGWALTWASLPLACWAMLTFWARRTSIVPSRPATTLVTSGPYRLSRNPMYVSLIALYVGLAFVFDVAWPLIALPVALFALRSWVIRPEERYLARAFGEEYAAYCRRVRRWL